MKKERVGIFGGTFNPPHNGHVSAAERFAEQMQLDRLIIIPSFIPPHKEYNSTVSCEERLQMCRLAFCDIPIVEISDIEIVRGGKSYTYLTLEELYRDDRELLFLCGTDMILSMDSWRNPEKIFALATICYIRREQEPENDSLIIKKCNGYRETYGARIVAIDAEAIDISSTQIRRQEDNRCEHVPAKVFAYIKDKGLYR